MEQSRSLIVKIHFRSNLRWRMVPTFLSLNLCNSAADCLILLKCGTEYDMTADTLQTFKVKESKVEVTVWWHVPAVKPYKTGVDRLIKLKLGENYHSAERNMWHILKIKESMVTITCLCPLFTIISVPYRKSKSPSPTVVLEFWPEARKYHFLCMCSTNLAKTLIDAHWLRNMPWIVAFVNWSITDLIIKTHNDWHDVGWPLRCNVSQLTPF